MKNLCLLLAGLLFIGCSERAAVTRPVDDAIKAGILIRGNGAEPESLDPHLATSVSAGNVLMNLFEGLTRLNPGDLSPEPGMAESWTVSEDGKEITFTLRPAVWSDGQSLTAEDFAYAFRRLLNPELGASYAFMLFPIENAQAIHTGEKSLSTLGVEVVDDQTLRIRLEKPTPYIFSLLAHWTAYPLPRHVVSTFGDATYRGGEWTRPENLVVNGAFVLEEWVDEDRIRLKKNPSYWQADEVQLNAAVFIPFSDTGAEERAFRAGDIHLTYSLPRHRLNHYRENQPDHLRVDTYLESVGYAVNLKHAALRDPRVRKALSLALDRNMITENVLYGVRKPAFHYVPPGTGGYQPASRLSENVDEAKRLMAEAGYAGGENFPEVIFIYPSAQDSQRVAEVIQQQWQQHLGIRIEIDNLERQTYFSRRRERDFDLCYFGWVGDYVDPTTFLNLWVSDAGNNLAGWKNPEYDALIARAPLAGEKRLDVLAEAEQLLLDELPILPLYFGATQYLKDPRVQGWDANLLDAHPLRVVSFQ